MWLHEVKQSWQRGLNHTEHLTWCKSARWHNIVLFKTNKSSRTRFEASLDFGCLLDEIRLLTRSLWSLWKHNSPSNVLRLLALLSNQKDSFCTAASSRASDGIFGSALGLMCLEQLSRRSSFCSYTPFYHLSLRSGSSGLLPQPDLMRFSLNGDNFANRIWTLMFVSGLENYFLYWTTATWPTPPPSGATMQPSLFN